MFLNTLPLRRTNCVAVAFLLNSELGSTFQPKGEVEVGYEQKSRFTLCTSVSVISQISVPFHPASLSFY